MLDRLRTALTIQPWRTAAGVLVVALVVSLAFNLSGGSDDPGDDPDPVAGGTSTTTSLDPTATSTTSTDDTTPATAPPATMPSGGFDQALVGIKVDNSSGARPQVGIGQAPILMEYAVEGGISRFTAVFPRESTGIVGPIRSLRPVDADLLPAVSPVVVSSGGQPFVIQDVEAAGVRNIFAGEASMFLSLGREAPHDLFVDLGLLSPIIDDSVLPVGGGLPFGDSLPAMQAGGMEVDSPLGPATFVFDEERGYVRMEGGAPFEVLDLSGENPGPLGHETLVFIFAAERSAGYTDSNDAPVSTYDVIGSGELLVFHSGQMLQGSWSRSALVDPFVFTDEAGATFGLPVGSTYVGVLPRGSSVSSS